MLSLTRFELNQIHLARAYLDENWDDNNTDNEEFARFLIRDVHALWSCDVSHHYQEMCDCLTAFVDHGGDAWLGYASASYRILKLRLRELNLI